MKALTTVLPQEREASPALRNGHVLFPTPSKDRCVVTGIRRRQNSRRRPAGTEIRQLSAAGAAAPPRGHHAENSGFQIQLRH